VPMRRVILSMRNDNPVLIELQKTQ